MAAFIRPDVAKGLSNQERVRAARVLADGTCGVGCHRSPSAALHVGPHHDDRIDQPASHAVADDNVQLVCAQANPLLVNRPRAGTDPSWYLGNYVRVLGEQRRIASTNIAMATHPDAAVGESDHRILRVARKEAIDVMPVVRVQLGLHRVVHAATVGRASSGVDRWSAAGPGRYLFQLRGDAQQQVLTEGRGDQLDPDRQPGRRSGEREADGRLTGDVERHREQRDPRVALVDAPRLLRIRSHLLDRRRGLAGRRSQ
jgi:hypothetical protein